MDTTTRHNRQRWAAQILDTSLSPINKIQKLVALGYEQEEAEAMVSGIQSGGMIYYEQLPYPDYDQHESRS